MQSILLQLLNIQKKAGLKKELIKIKFEVDKRS
jgi:hypothetical protein